MHLSKRNFCQIIRDPSSLIIAFVLPTLLLFIYAYGINLDFANVRLGIKNDDGSPATEELAGAFGTKPFYYRRTLRRQKTNAGRPYPRKNSGRAYHSVGFHAAAGGR